MPTRDVVSSSLCSCPYVRRAKPSLQQRMNRNIYIEHPSSWHSIDINSETLDSSRLLASHLPSIPYHTMHIHLSSLLVLAATLLPLSPARPILDASELSGLEINPVTISQSFTNVRHLVKRGKEEDLARHEAYKAARAARVIEAEKRSKNKYRAEVVEARKVAALDKKIAGEQAQLASAASASARAQLPVVAAPSAAPPPELTPEEVAAAIDADNKVRKNALARLDRKKEALFELRDRINNHTKTIQALHARHIEVSKRLIILTGSKD